MPKGLTQIWAKVQKKLPTGSRMATQDSHCSTQPALVMSLQVYFRYHQFLLSAGNMRGYFPCRCKTITASECSGGERYSYLAFIKTLCAFVWAFAKSISFTERLIGAKRRRHPGIDPRLVNIRSALEQPSAKAQGTKENMFVLNSSRTSSSVTSQCPHFSSPSSYGNLHTNIQNCEIWIDVILICRGK